MYLNQPVLAEALAVSFNVWRWVPHSDDAGRKLSSTPIDTASFIVDWLLCF